MSADRYSVNVLVHLNLDVVVQAESGSTSDLVDAAIEQVQKMVLSNTISEDHIADIDVIEWRNMDLKRDLQSVVTAVNDYFEFVRIQHDEHNDTAIWDRICGSVLELLEADCVHEVRDLAFENGIRLDLEDSRVFDSILMGLRYRCMLHKLEQQQERNQ